MSRPKGLTDAEWRAIDTAKKASWRKRNPEKQKIIEKRRRESGKDKICSRRFHEAHPEYGAQQAKRQRDAKPELYRAIGARYRERNIDRVRAMKRITAKKCRPQAMARHKIRYAMDVQYNLAIKLRARIGNAFRKAKNGTRKLDTGIKLLGCSFAEFQKHIESQFKADMTWEKVLSGEIHIDHIKPISSFDLTDPLQQKAAFHFTNCQPLWAQENQIKFNKIIQFKAA